MKKALIVLLLTQPVAAIAATGEPLFDLEHDGLARWEGAIESFGVAARSDYRDASTIYSVVHSQPNRTGELRSPTFKLTKPVIGFQLLGLYDYEEARIGLEIDGRMVLTANGWNIGETLPTYFRVERWKGSDARIVFMDDKAASGWIGAGEFMFHDSAEAFMQQQWGTDEEDIIIADWADGSYQGWTPEGDAFRDTPMNLSLNRYAGYDVRGYIGPKYVASSRDQGRDRIDHQNNVRNSGKGTLTSPEFEIRRPYINIQMAGGDDRDNLYVELLVGGRQVRQAFGYEHQQVEWATFDVREFSGRKAVLRLVDKVELKNWDCILAGLIIQGNEQYGEIEPDNQLAGITFKETFRPRFHYTARSGWINDPNGFVHADGWYHIMSQATDFGEGMNTSWGHARSRNMFDLDYLARVASPAHTRRSAGHPGLPKPSPTTAIFPGACWSGSAIVDSDNVSGLKQGEHDPILCYISSSDQDWIPGERHVQLSLHQYIACSTDGGMSWKPVKTDKDGKALPSVVNLGYQLTQMTGKGKNELLEPAGPPEEAVMAKTFEPGREPGVKPVLYTMNRDPKVIWHEPSRKFVMVLFTGRGSFFALLESRNLLDWRWKQTMRLPEGMHECPDLFELAIDDDKNSMKWVFLANNTYIIGDFDGDRFIPDSYYEKHRCAVNHGQNAGPLQLFNHAPGGRKICMAWMGAGAFRAIRSPSSSASRWNAV